MFIGVAPGADCLDLGGMALRDTNRMVLKPWAYKPGNPHPIVETVETVPTFSGSLSTQLKQGVNEIGGLHSEV